MQNAYQCIKLNAVLCLSIALVFSQTLFAADFTIINGQVVTTTQTLNSDGDVGVIEAGGQLNTIGNAVNATASNVMVNNNGTITSNNRGINTSGNVTITNSGRIVSNSRGINTFGDNIIIFNSGSITSNADRGIEAFSNNVTITNSGTITSNTRGINTSGSNATITNSGTITSNTRGINTSGSNATIANSGTITSDNRGIFSRGADATITNSGTTTSNDDGINSRGDDVTINNSGTITSNDDGINSSGADAVIVSSGSIVSNTGHGILANGINSKVTNDGSITFGSSSRGGIVGFASSANAEFTNNGTILVSANSAAGMAAFGVNSVLINTGKIIVDELSMSAEGIQSSGANSIIINNGDITISGNVNNGIYSNGANADITNNGNIITSGTTTHGFQILAQDATIANHGSIQVTGTNSIAVNLDGGNAILNNSGLLSATGNATTAILGDAGDQTVNLNQGSQIIGLVDLGGGTDTVNYLEPLNASTSITFMNTENINVAPGSAAVRIGDTVTTMDTTGPSVLGESVSAVSSNVHNTVSKRTSSRPLAPVEMASLETTSGIEFVSRAPVAWSEVYGSNRERGDDGSTLAYEQDTIGFVSGYERDFEGRRVGFMFGYADSEIETDVQSIETDVSSYYAGVYSYFELGDYNLVVSLMGGYEDYENDRYVVDNINGIETANSDFDNYFISPSITISSLYRYGEKIKLRPSANLAYTAAFFDSYDESGTTSSNLEIDDRTVHVVNGYAQLAGVYPLNRRSELELRVGADARYTDEDDVKASLAGSNFKYGSTDDDSVIGGYVGGTLRMEVQSGLSLVGDVQYHSAEGDEDELAGVFRMEYVF